MAQSKPYQILGK